MFRAWLIVISCCSMSNGWASNELREIQYAEEIEASFSIGKIVWLEAKTKNFLALYTETEALSNLGTAILLHPIDGHPDQKKIINPLRTYLPKHNWATLSLQLPVQGVAAKEAEYYPLFDDANARIQAAIDYLVAEKVKNIVLIGYDMGGMMAAYYLKENRDKKQVKAVVTISLAAPKTDHKQAQVVDFIAEINQPFFDIYAEFDSPDVTESARKRRVSGKSNPQYRQFEVAGEGHLFQHDEGLVVKRVYSWINRTFR